MPAPNPNEAVADQKWLRWGYAFIGLFLITRLAYLAAGCIELSEDEAYQWLWSKHLALSYFSKPPLIAYLQFLGTSLWGDTQFGIRFFSPVMAAVLSVALLRFMAREVNPRAAFLLIVILAATPLTAVGATLLTVDAPSVFFWVLAMIAGWRAVQSNKEDRRSEATAGGLNERFSVGRESRHAGHLVPWPGFSPIPALLLSRFEVTNWDWKALRSYLLSAR